MIGDRILQALTLNALEPEWEARFEPRSYGFRPGRGCQDALQAIYLTVKGKRPARQWILDADLAGAFDRIDHRYLLRQLAAFPARGMIGRWLKAGVVDRGCLTPTQQGTPQGGVLSPLLLNIALHGMEQAAGVRYATGTEAGRTMRNSPVLIRYADDLVCLCHTRAQAEQAKARLAEWLAPRGLAFNQDKTRIVTLGEGFDFLGCNIRHYPNGKLLIKPSTAAVRRIRERLAAELHALRGANAAAVIATLNPIIRGWAAYYRHVVSSHTFHALDAHLWRLVYKWARHSHPNKPRTWVTAHYFGRFNPSRNDRWIFGDQNSGAYLRKFSWTRIVRHQLVPAAASPDDPALADYWASRRQRQATALDSATRRMLHAQAGRCPYCRGLLLLDQAEPQTPHQWEQWIKATRLAIRKHAITPTAGAGTSDEPVALQLIHTHCQRRLGTATRQ